MMSSPRGMETSRNDARLQAENLDISPPKLIVRKSSWAVLLLPANKPSLTKRGQVPFY